MRFMATRPVVTAVIAKPSPPPTKSSNATNGTGNVTVPSKPDQLKPLSLRLLPPASATAASLATIFYAPVSDARPFFFPKQEILSSLVQAEEAIGQVEDVGSAVLNYTTSVFKVLSDALRPTVEVATPVVQKVGEEALKIASPLVFEASKQAQEALQSAGVDPLPVISVAKTFVGAAQESAKVIEGAKPIASATIESISSNDPAVIVGSAGALLLAYFLFPPVWSAITFSLRGFKGKVSAAQTLELVTSQNYILIDIRSEKDKNKSGIPRLPSNATNKLISLPLEELPSKIKGLVRDAKKVEAEIVALKISYLKKVNRGSSIVIMDSYCNTAKVAAKWLTASGFNNVWVMAGGFSGGRGWSQSRLGTESYFATLPEILSPSRIIPASVGQFGTTSATSRQATRRLLPGSIE